MTNCVLCKDDLKPEEGQLIWRGDDCRVILVNDRDLSGPAWSNKTQETQSAALEARRKKVQDLPTAIKTEIAGLS